MHEWFDTTQTSRVAGALRKLPRIGGLGLVTGSVGVGKSAAVSMAASQTDGIYHVRVVPSDGVPAMKSFLCEVALELGMDVPHQWSAAQLGRALAAEVEKRGATVVLDNIDAVRAGQMEYIRYLSDILPHLVLVGDERLGLRIDGSASVRARIRLPLEMQPVSREELGGCFGFQFSEAWLDVCFERTAGNWAGIWQMVTPERERADATGRSTRELTADDAVNTARLFLLLAA